MYHALLTRKYTTTKMMPLLSVIAVMLCAAMVLITWSIMGGFLTMLLKVGRDMEGDVSITWPTVGFAHYEDLITRLEADPMVAAAAPVIDSFGLITLPDDRVLGVRIRGIDERFARVTAYREALWWKPITEPLEKDKAGMDPRLDVAWSGKKPRELLAFDPDTDRALLARFRPWDQLEQEGVKLESPDPRTGQVRPAVVLGIELSGFSTRSPEGWYRPSDWVGRRQVTGNLEYMPGFTPLHSVTLNLLPTDRKGRSITPVSRRLPVANEYRTGLFDADKGTVLINLAELQRMLLMNEAERLESQQPDPYAIEGEQTARRKVIGTEPARVTTVIVRGKDGPGSPQVEALRERCVEIYAKFAAAHGPDVPPLGIMEPPGNPGSRITTFRRAQAQFIGQVEKETQLVLFLLLFISFVAVFLILAIFWSMVSEKTKDIGVLRSVGASRLGVAWLWLRYGLVIGVIGAVLGVAFAHMIVWNINPIHEWMGRQLGITIWDPRVYYFPTIPHEVVPWKAGVVGLGGIVFSVLGALIPAVKAARMDPVKALRFE